MILITPCWPKKAWFTEIISKETVEPPCVQRPTVTGPGPDLAPAPQNLGSVGLAPEREKLTVMGLPANGRGVYSMLDVIKEILFHSKALWRIF